MTQPPVERIWNPDDECRLVPPVTLDAPEQAMSIVLPFSRDFDCEYGVADAVAPGLRRVVANNPSPFTFKGTNSYIVGTGMVAVIDPGPDDEAHRSALLAELERGGERVSHIFLTHT